MSDRNYLTWTRRFLAAMLLAAMLLASFVGATARAEGDAAELEVYFLDLGRVDGILIRCGGSASFVDVGFKSDAKKAISWLRAMGITHLDSYIGTHSHYDHIEGAADMIEAFRPDCIYVSHMGCLTTIRECASEAQQAIIADTEKVILLPGVSFAIGPATMTCLGPVNIVSCNAGDNDENENSLVLRLEYGQRRLLLTGDTTDAVLRYIDELMPGCLRADVLKNPHHNGAHDADVIDLISPRYVVFCTDDSNIPRESYLDLLSERSIGALITGPANQGHVAVITDGQRLEIRCGVAVNAVRMEPISDMYPGQTLRLKCAVEPEGALVPDRQLGFNSSDESVAVAELGRVRAVRQGTATITAAALNGASASVEVRVMDACMALESCAVKIAVGETRKLNGRIMPRSAKGYTAAWTSEDESVAAVSDGRVTGVGEGQTRVVARLSNGAVTYCDITVAGQVARSIRFDQKKITMKAGDTLALTPAIDPADYDPDCLEWTSSDDSVLWVDHYGNVTAVKKGKARVTVVSTNGVEASCTIKVG